MSGFFKRRLLAANALMTVNIGNIQMREGR
jgi:hypothetical protein